MFTMASKNVSVIILNWNGWQMTIECLESLYQNIYDHFYVIVVDNGSQDNSIEEIKKYCYGQTIIQSAYYQYNPNNKPINVTVISKKESENGVLPNLNFTYKQLIIIENDFNYGFAEGSNIGIRYALNTLQSDYILTLNNDTVVDKDFLVHLIKAAEKESNIGACQSKILAMNSPGLIDAIGINISFLRAAYQAGYHQKDCGQYDNDLDIFGACACSALYKSKMLQEIGLFDEDFFAYYEDVDLAWRARLYLWKALYVHDSIVYHTGSASGSGIKDYYRARNRLSYLIKNAPIYMIVLGIFNIVRKIPVIIRGKYGLKEVRKEECIIIHYSKMLRKRKLIRQRLLLHASSIISNGLAPRRLIIPTGMSCKMSIIDWQELSLWG